MIWQDLLVSSKDNDFKDFLVGIVMWSSEAKTQSLYIEPIQILEQQNILLINLCKNLAASSNPQAVFG